MIQMKRAILYFLFLFALSMLPSCILFKSLDKSAEDAVVRLDNRYHINLDSLAHDLAENATIGLIDGLADDSSQIKMNQVFRELLKQFSDSLNIMIVESRNSLLNEQTDSLLKQRIEKLTLVLKTELKKLLDDPMSTEIDILLNKLTDHFTSKESIDKFRVLRDTLLGTELKALTDSIVRSAIRNAMDEVSKYYDLKLKNKIDNTISNAEDISNKTIGNLRKLIWLLGLVGFVLIVVTGYFYLQGKKNKDTLKVITFQIDKIKEQKIYDELVRSIREKSTERGLEKHLQTILKEQDLYQQPEWLDKNLQLLNLIVKSINEIRDDNTKARLIAELIEKAKEIGLDDRLDELVKT